MFVSVGSCSTVRATIFNDCPSIGLTSTRPDTWHSPTLGAELGERILPTFDISGDTLSYAGAALGRLTGCNGFEVRLIALQDRTPARTLKKLRCNRSPGRVIHAPTRGSHIISDLRYNAFPHCQANALTTVLTREMRLGQANALTVFT
eukprot:sb/3473738/